MSLSSLWNRPEARAARMRLAAARNVLAAAGVMAFFAGFSEIGPKWAALGLALLIGVAMLPRRSSADRLAEQRRREEAFAWEKAAQILLDSVDMPAILLAGEGVLVQQNRISAQRFGQAERGAHLSALIRSPAILNLVDDAIESGRPGFIEHFERIPSERWYMVRVAPVPDLPQPPEGGTFVILTFTDVTEARRMERTRSDFVANASHELRTPLASLTGFIETLQGPARKDPKAQEQFLAIMLEQAGRMTRLVDDLMSLSRLELKAHVPPASDVELGELLAHVCDALGPLASDLDVTIRFTPPTEQFYVEGDRDELIQVFENLIENACKYAQEGKYVDVTIARITDAIIGTRMIEVQVRDYGPGIPEEHVPRITERFYRVSVETSRSKKGTGLGLAIVKHILTRHRARLVVRSKLNEGSVFVARFPEQSVDNSGEPKITE